MVRCAPLRPKPEKVLNSSTSPFRTDALSADRSLLARMRLQAREAASQFPWSRGVKRFEELCRRSP